MTNINELPKLSYAYDSKTVPVGNDLITIEAEPWFEISKDFFMPEGLIVDRAGENLYFCNINDGEVHRLELATMKKSMVMEPRGFEIGAVKIHKDGRLFICSMGKDYKAGGVFAMNPDGSNFETIVDPSHGYIVDDLTFNSEGGFYFTDFKGYATNEEGGVYYVSPDYKTITPIIKNIAVANGIALKTDDKTLWVTETCGNRILHVELLDDRATVAPFGVTVPYYLTGYLGPDSCCIDSDDNLYIAMYCQSRFLVLNKNGFPIGQIRLPETKDGRMTRTTSITFLKDSDQAIMCAHDGRGGKGAWLYTARGFAEGHKTYQFQ